MYQSGPRVTVNQQLLCRTSALSCKRSSVVNFFSLLNNIFISSHFAVCHLFVLVSVGGTLIFLFYKILIYYFMMHIKHVFTYNYNYVYPQKL